MAIHLQPFLAVVAGATAAALAALDLNAVVTLLAVSTCVLFASGLRPPGAADRLEAAVPPAEPPAPPRTEPVPLQVRTFIDGLPGPLLVIGGSGRLVHANDAAGAALPNVQVGGHFVQLIRAPAFIETVSATIADGAPRDVEFTSHLGTERNFEARVARMPLLSAEDEPMAIVLLEDRTRGRRAEQQRSDFIANASHELRTPLATIIGYIETLQNHARDDAEAQQRFLAIMAREAARMQRLVDDLMSLSRIEMNEHLRPDERLPIFRIVAESAAALQPLARQHGVDLTIGLDPDGGGEVLGDRDQLVQVFTNLIDNAVKYGGTRVEVMEAPPSRANPNRIGVEVRDTGPGITREHLPRLTERFYRANIGQSRARGGTGLGLAIVKHILNRHRGRLEIASEPGTGSVFTVWLAPAPEVDGTERPRAAPGDGAAINGSNPAG